MLHDYLARVHPDLVPVLPETVVTRAYWIAYHESLRNLARVQAVNKFLADLVGASRADFTPERPPRD